MKLTDEQLYASNHKDGPALVLAVPGAGKTTMLLYRTINLINMGIDPNKILSITFSRASARDMNKRFKHLFPHIKYRLNFSTIHSFCYSIILDYGKIKNINYTLIESTESKVNKLGLLKNIYYTINHSILSDEKLQTLLSQIGYCKNMLLQPEFIPREQVRELPNFSQVYRTYEDYKDKNKLLDFDDMVTLSNKIIEENPYLKNKYRNKYDYIQVDEGQDTSKAQMKIIKSIARNNNIFIVADDDQSIYGFRGAHPDGLFKLKDDYSNLKTYFLQTNFRSTKNIVETGNIFIQANENRFKKTILPNNDFGKSVNIIKFDNSIDQYKFILDKIKDSKKSSAILYRNNISALGVVEYFERENMDFQIRDHKTKIFNHWLVKDILNIIYFSKNQNSIKCFDTIYYKIKGYISKKHVAYLKNNYRSENLLKELMNYPGLSTRYKGNVRELMHDFNTLSKLNPSNALDFICNTLCYDHYLKDFSQKFGYTYKNIKIYISNLKFIAQNTPTFEGFIGRLKHLEYLLNNSFNSDSKLTFSTIHGAKGLEFDEVYILDLVEGMLPSPNSIDELRKGNKFPIEEERRVFYVAMTRAKYELYLLYPEKIFSESYPPSQFLKDLLKI